MLQYNTYVTITAMSQLKIGDKAPSFCLTGHNGQLYCLPELLKFGPVALVFYPYDQSPNCTKLLCSINTDKDIFDAKGITLLGINNASEESHKVFANKRNLLMPLLSDLDYSVSKLYNALWKIGPIKVIRYVTVGIGQNGKVIYYAPGRPTNRTIIESIITPAQA